MLRAANTGSFSSNGEYIKGRPHGPAARYAQPLPGKTCANFAMQQSPRLTSGPHHKGQTLHLKRQNSAPLHLLLFPFRVLLLNETATCLIHVTKK